MKIKDIKKENRPREKIIKNGITSLSDEELLAILLRCGNKNKSVIELSYEIINKAGNLKRLSNYKYNELIKINGIKESKACILLAAFEISKRAFSYKNNNTLYDNPKNVFELISPFLRLETTESLYILYLDSKCRLIEKELISRGGVNNCIVPIQLILKRVLDYSGCGVILVHNHPSGDCNPSKEDIKTSLDLKDSLEMLGLYLFDHVIIADNNYYSFNDNDIL